MTNLDQVSDTIRQQLQDVQKKIESLKKTQTGQKFEQSKKYEKQLDRIKNLLQSYEYSISDAVDSDILGSHESQYKQYKTKFKQLQKLLEFNRNEDVGQNDLFKNRTKQNQQQRNQRQQVIQKGHRLQEQGMEGLKNARNNLYKMDQQADVINTELNKQIQQLDSIYDNMKDTQTTLKRAQTHLRYFARQIYTDRLMICLIIVIIAAIITIIGLKIAGKTPQISIDQIK